MRASPGLSSGFGASSYTSCSGPPRLCNRMAFIVISPPLVFSSREPSRRKVSALFAVPLSAADRGHLDLPGASCDSKLAAPVEIAHDLRALDHVFARQACDVRG